jgi:hypothetical protein
MTTEAIPLNYTTPLSKGGVFIPRPGNWSALMLDVAEAIHVVPALGHPDDFFHISRVNSRADVGFSGNGNFKVSGLNDFKIRHTTTPVQGLDVDHVLRHYFGLKDPERCVWEWQPHPGIQDPFGLGDIVAISKTIDSAWGHV